MAALKVNDQTFSEEVLQSQQPVLIDFWAPWCGPCRAMSSVVDEVAHEVSGKAKVVKVNIDDAPDTATEFGIQSIPSFVVVQGGEVQKTVTGVVPKQTLVDLFD